MQKIEIGIIAGSGLENLREKFSGVKKIKIKTPFGYPSDFIYCGDFAGIKVAFLARHGEGHFLLPGEINYRANIYALKILGVQRIISLYAVGSLQENILPGDIVIPDQFFDFTHTRISTFFGDGLVVHTDFSWPVCKELTKIFLDIAKESTIKVHHPGTYLAMEGPQFSTFAEANIYKNLGFSVAGMTALPEARLAREAEICYLNICLVTNYEAWKQDIKPNVEEVLNQVNKSYELLINFLEKGIAKIPKIRECSCKDALKGALQTSPEKINQKKLKKLKELFGRDINL